MVFARIKRGWNLARSSLHVVWLDKEILLLPILSAVVLILVTLSMLGVGVFGLGLVGPETLENLSQGEAEAALYGVTFLYYIVSYFIVIFFNSAVVECANIRFGGGDPTVRDGLRKAWARKARIFQWSLLAATVGIILRIARDKAKGFADRLILGGVGLAWNIATYFVVPVLVTQDLGPVDAIKKSGSTMKAAWGEALSGEIGQGLLFFLAGLLWLLVMLGLLFGLPLSGAAFVVWVVVFVVGGIILLAAKAAADAVLIAGLYRYAETGELPDVYRGAELPPPRQQAGAA